MDYILGLGLSLPKTTDPSSKRDFAFSLEESLCICTHLRRINIAFILITFLSYRVPLTAGSSRQAIVNHLRSVSIERGSSTNHGLVAALKRGRRNENRISAYRIIEDRASIVVIQTRTSTTMYTHLPLYILAYLLTPLSETFVRFQRSYGFVPLRTTGLFFLLSEMLSRIAVGLRRGRHPLSVCATSLCRY